MKSNAPKDEEASHAGCTANVVLITPDWIYCANSGDSRSIAIANKKMVALSEDHKPEDPKEDKRIKKAGGTVEDGRVNGNLNLSRALGDL
jgi:serine/threonine protein phosphatase PrpC